MGGSAKQGPGKTPIHFLILTGTSGSGKSHALKCLEDIGYYCVDNLPLALLPEFAERFEQLDPPVPHVALVVDVRERFPLEESAALLSGLRHRGHTVETIFFDADDAVLIRRFSETRRPHPLARDGGVPAGLKEERKLLAPLRNTAERHINTSAFSVHDLREYVQRQYSGGDSDRTLTISIIAFGYKYGIPLEADLLFDVRFLNNPHFVPHLKEHTGVNPQVREYVMADRRAHGLIDRIVALLSFTIPGYVEEGRSYLTIGIGCTGGKHRSVVIAHQVAERLGASGPPVEVRLRDAPPEQTEGAQG